MSPLAKSGGYISATHANHYSLLATVEDGLALPRLGSAATAQPLTDFFPSQQSADWSAQFSRAAKGR